MFLGDIEVFRTTTAEPGDNEIAWTYLKEVDHFLSLWKTPQKLIFDLPNIIDETYNGPLFTTLSATFFTVPENDARPVADQILPISQQTSSKDQSGAFVLPNQKATVSHVLPQNVKRAVVSLTANGQQREEYWFRNSLTSDHEKKYFPSAIRATQPYSPFREVQLLIDGQLAGVSWPFPNMFTGGINPLFWRPIAGIDAFDIREHEIDITPWLGVLCDGAPHEFDIRVASLDDDGKGHATLSNKVNWYWLVSGSIFLFLGDDSTKTPTWLAKPRIAAPDPSISVSSNPRRDKQGTVESLSWQVSVKRSLEISASLVADPSKSITWKQDLTFSNDNLLSNGANAQKVVQRTTGLDVSSPVGYINAYEYPHAVNWNMDRSPDGFQITGDFDQGLTYNTAGPSLISNGIQSPSFAGPDKKSLCPLPSTFKSWPKNMFETPALVPASFLKTWHRGQAKYGEAEKGEHGLGSNSVNQDFTFDGLCIPGSTPPQDLRKPAAEQKSQQELERYTRKVKVADQAVTNEEDFSLVGVPLPVPDFSGILHWKRPADTGGLETGPTAGQPTQPSGIDASIQAILGIGPGALSPGFEAAPGNGSPPDELEAITPGDQGTPNDSGSIQVS